MSKKRQQRKRPGPKRGVVGPADAYGGWVVAGDGRTVIGRCACGEPAVVDCPVCGPQCQSCFVGVG
jgi:hypothetical protein